MLRNWYRVRHGAAMLAEDVIVRQLDTVAELREKLEKARIEQERMLSEMRAALRELRAVRQSLSVSTIPAPDE